MTLAIIEHFHFHMRGHGKEGRPQASNSVVMRQVRCITRSMILPEGFVVATDDGHIIWNPKQQKQKRVKISSIATVLHAVRDKSGKLELIVVGDSNGGIHIIGISSMSIKCSFNTNSAVRSLCASSMHDKCVIVGCENGSIHMVGESLPAGIIHLVELENPASALRLEGRMLKIIHGWETTEFELQKTLMKKSNLLIVT